MAAAARPRYAPEDPTLPKPWRALVDGTTSYVYFWNPQTNVTTYEKPTSGDLKPTSDEPKPDQKPTSDEPKPDQKPEEKPSPQQWGQQNRNGDAGGGGRGGDSQNSTYQNQGTRFANSTSLQSSAKNGNGSSNMHISGPSVQFQPAPREGGKRDAGGQPAAEAYRRQHEITATEDVPHPFATFDSTGFPSDILKEVLRAGFSAPTPIQAQSWPIALEGRDIVAVAKTGSGKTLGYVIPGFIHLKRLRNNSKMGPTVLVLSPTRELATQIHEEAEKFGRSSSISSVCLYGGAPKGPQLRDLCKGADIVIATPGRLNDILEMKRVSLDQVSYLVLDEADRMLDMGFEPQIRKIVNEIPPRRQTLMFTATWPKEVRKIAGDLLNNPVQVNIGNVDELVANKSITQYVEVISHMEKQRRLEQLLRSQAPGSKIIIFCATKRMCDQLARNLTRQFGAAAIHGDKCQSERDSVLAQFRSGNSPILVATDVAARGLDVKDIRIVVNYDFPTGVEDYVHRIGRTGRAGAKGEAYTFFCDQDSKYASDLVKILEGADQCVPSELRDMVSRGGYGGKSRRWGSSSDSYGGGRSNAYSGGRSDSYGGGRSYGGRGGSSYGGDKSDNTYGGGGGSSYGGDKSDDTYGGGGGGYGDQKPSYDRREESGPVWSHDKAISSGGSYGNNSGRSRSRSPVSWQA